MTHQKLGDDQEMIVGDSSPKKKKTSNKENAILMEGSSQEATKYRKLITEVNEKI